MSWTPALSCAKAEECSECSRDVPHRNAAPSRCAAFGQIPVDIEKTKIDQRSPFAGIPSEKLKGVLSLSIAGLLRQTSHFSRPATILVQVFLKWHDDDGFMPPAQKAEPRTHEDHELLPAPAPNEFPSPRDAAISSALPYSAHSLYCNANV